MTAPARIRQADVIRLMRGFRQAGYTSVRVDITPEGGMTITGDDTAQIEPDDWRSKQPLYRNQ